MSRRSGGLAKVQRQFGRQACCYARSRVHSEGTSLPVLLRLGNPSADQLMLDVATGTGFTSFAFAPFVDRVLASDVTVGMLEQARLICRERGLKNVFFQAANAEALPYQADIFDIATCRIAPHHFTDVPAFLREMWRVLRPGGLVLLADTSSPAAGEVQEWHNRVERLRDPSHLRSYTAAQLKALVEQAGFTVDTVHNRCRTRQVFSNWVKTSGTPAYVERKLRDLFAKASEPVWRAFRIVRHGDDFRFSWSVTIVRARKETPGHRDRAMPRRYASQ